MKQPPFRGRVTGALGAGQADHGLASGLELLSPDPSPRPPPLVVFQLRLRRQGTRCCLSAAQGPDNRALKEIRTPGTGFRDHP